MPISLFVRMRELMFQDTALQAFFGPTMDLNKFRVFDRQFPPGASARGTCATIQTVSQITTPLHGVPMNNPLTQDWVQINVIDPRPGRANDAAAAVQSFLDTANFVDNSAFSSPPITPSTPGQNVKLNQRGAFITDQTNVPIPVEQLDYRIWNVNP